MSDEVISLAEQRALKASDSRLWSPSDCLRALLRDLDTGAIKASAIMVHWYEMHDDGSRTLMQANANLDREQAIAMTVLAQDKALREWKA